MHNVSCVSNGHLRNTVSDGEQTWCHWYTANNQQDCVWLTDQTLHEYQRLHQSKTLKSLSKAEDTNMLTGWDERQMQMYSLAYPHRPLTSSSSPAS